MRERTFRVVDEHNHILATGMSFDMAIVFIKGYYDTYYMELLNLRIVEYDDSVDREEEG